MNAQRCPLKLIFLAGMLFPLAAFASSPENPGATAASVLQIPLGARALGMGTAFTSVASDVSALYYNPAGLSRLGAHEVSAMFSLGLADNTLNYLAYGGPVPFSGLTGNGYVSAGASVLYSRAGSVEINTLNPDGSLANSAVKSAGSDLVAAVGYSERVGMNSFDWDRGSYEINHFVGVSGELIHSTLGVQYSANAAAADLGYLVACPEAGLSAGFSALHFGSKMTFVAEGDPLPATLRYGASYERGRATDHAWIFAADGDYLVNDKIWHAYGGLEHLWRKKYAVRLGYQFNRDSVGLTVGFGYRWRGRVLVDYAWASESGSRFSDTQRFTLTYRFGDAAGSSQSQTRRPFIEKKIETPTEENQIQGVDNGITPVETPAQKPRKAPKSPLAIPGWIY